MTQSSQRLEQTRNQQPIDCPWTARPGARYTHSGPASTIDADGMSVRWRSSINKSQKKQMAYFHDLLQPVCGEPIVALSYLFARASILDGVLRIVADVIPIPGNPVPSLPGALVDKMREQHVERAGDRTQALCAVTATRIVAVGVAPRPAAGGLASNYWDLTVATEPLILRRDAITTEVKRRLVSKVVIFTETETRRYEFEVHVLGTGDFNDAFFAALATVPQT